MCPSPLRRALAGALALVIVTVGLGSGVAPASAYPDRANVVSIDGACEGQLLRLHNDTRADAGLPRLREDPAYDQVTRAWAQRMANEGVLHHNPGYAQQIGSLLPWYTMGENVGYGQSAATLHDAYMNSPGHRANILSANYQRIAVGCYRDGSGRVWTAVNFVGSQAAVADRVPQPFLSAGDAVTRLRWWTLGASPSDAVLDFDANQFLTGQTNVPGYAMALTASPGHEATAPPVTRLYAAVFLREPDAGGLNYWIRLNQAGHSLENIANAFAGSAEFQDRYGRLSNRAFVELVYRNVLRRAPDVGGLNYWTGLIDRGMTRGRMQIGFSESAEFTIETRADTAVSWASIQLLGRTPTAGERAAWTGQLDRGGSVATLVDSLVRSPTFTYRAASGSY